MIGGHAQRLLAKHPRYAQVLVRIIDQAILFDDVQVGLYIDEGGFIETFYQHNGNLFRGMQIVFAQLNDQTARKPFSILAQQLLKTVEVQQKQQIILR